MRRSYAIKSSYRALDIITLVACYYSAGASIQDAAEPQPYVSSTEMGGGGGKVDTSTLMYM